MLKAVSQSKKLLSGGGGVLFRARKCAAEETKRGELVIVLLKQNGSTAKFAGICFKKKLAVLDGQRERTLCGKAQGVAQLRETAAVVIGQFKKAQTQR